MIEKIGPTLYKGESIYKIGAGGGVEINETQIYTFFPNLSISGNNIEDNAVLKPDTYQWKRRNTYETITQSNVTYHNATLPSIKLTTYASWQWCARLTTSCKMKKGDCLDFVLFDDNIDGSVKLLCPFNTLAAQLFQVQLTTQYYDNGGAYWGLHVNDEVKPINFHNGAGYTNNTEDRCFFPRGSVVPTLPHHLSMLLNDYGQLYIYCDGVLYFDMPMGEKDIYLNYFASNSSKSIYLSSIRFRKRCNDYLPPW